MKRIFRLAIIIALVALLLSSCTKNYQKTVESLKTELAQTGDTILAYSLDKHFAIWVHADTANMIWNDYEVQQGAPNVYYYDLRKGEKELLFKTGDSLFCETTNSYITLGYFDIGVTPDNLGLIIDFTCGDYTCSYLYPLSKKGVVIEGINRDLIGSEPIDLDIEPKEIGAIDYSATIKIHYNGNGDIISKSDSVTIITENYSIYTFPKELLKNKNELKNYFLHQKFRFGDPNMGVKYILEVKYNMDFGKERTANVIIEISSETRTILNGGNNGAIPNIFIGEAEIAKGYREKYLGGTLFIEGTNKSKEIRKFGWFADPRNVISATILSVKEAFIYEDDETWK